MWEQVIQREISYNNEINKTALWEVLVFLSVYIIFISIY